MSNVVRFWGTVLLIAIVIAAISFISMKAFKNKPMAKFVPTLLIWGLSVILFIYGRFFAEPMQDLGYYAMSMITGAATFIAAVITIVVDKYKTCKNK